ncbi:TMEM132 [Lepeophtheirus salmonis]|uniref:TMEM132 n=1 Tax=Lepeophtheirus salmonis TaxID=72036 RepID=A0A7R8CKX3_LEPSM|nr:TMEM132 [Lepeophtheirus salmonis]CAF2824012.1 TMEM132 [Lepeophtheirus salmonis]
MTEVFRFLGTVLSILFLSTGWAKGLDVHFEDPTAGFFFRETRTSSDYVPSTDYSLRRLPSSPAAEPTTSIVLNSVSSSSSSHLPNSSRFSNVGPGSELADDVLHTARFVVLKTATPVLIRAEYGPFEQRQTVPTQYVVPDLSEGSSPPFNSSSKPGLITDFKPHGLDLSAHPVTTEIPRDKPVLRVLFHAGGHGGPYRSLNGAPRTICIRLYVSLRNETKSTCCSPDGRDGTCLGQLTLPSRWWPSLVFNGSEEGGKTKHPKIIASISYSVEEARGNSCSGNLDSRVSIIPVIQLAKIPLVQPRRGYRQLAQDEILHMLIPQTPLYPNSRLYVPVFLDQPEDDRQISVVKIRCHSRSGIKILVTVFRKKDAVTFLHEDEPQNYTSNYEESNQTEDYGGVSGPVELFNWLLSVDDRDFELWNAGKITWAVEYQYADGFAEGENNTMSGESDGDFSSEGSYPLSRNGKKLKAKLHVQKDDAQAVLPIAKHSELINLAVLTGHQISKPLKIFTVTEAGEIADVTLRSSCVSTENSVLKVSSSCTSVYVDGSETHTRLSQIKGWRVPSYKKEDNERNKGKRSIKNNEKSSSDWSNEKNGRGNRRTSSDKLSCSLRYQQSTVTIYGTFLAEDLDSGRKDFYPSRGSELDITELLISSGVVRIAKSNIALLRNNIIQGLSPGKTYVHVMSPISGKEIGKAEFRVAKNRESIVGMNIRILSGLKLSIHADQSHRRRGKYSLQTAYSKVLSSKYQEGLVDVSLLFSDETVVPLSDIDINQYHLTVKSLDPRTVAFAPLKGGKYPRIIAVGSGRGKLLRVSVELPKTFLKKKILLMTKSRHPDDRRAPIKTFFEDHATLVAHKKSVDMGDLGDMIQDEEISQAHLESSQRHRNGGGYLHSYRSHPSLSHPRHYIDYTHLTPLEVGLYVLLAVFCATIAIFVASCFVYASRHRKVEYPMNTSTTATRSIKSHQSVQNAHDWVWLGKSSSMDDKSVQSNLSSHPPHPDVLRQQRRYRQRASYMGSEVNIIPNPRTEEFELSVSDPNTPIMPSNSHLNNSENTGGSAPAIPPHQNLRGAVKKNTNPFLYDEEELEREYLIHKSNEKERGYHPFCEVYDTVEGSKSGCISQFHPGTFDGKTFKQEEIQLPGESLRSSQMIDSSTYTKKSSSIHPEGMILPVGFPIFSQDDENVSSSSSWDEEEEQEEDEVEEEETIQPPLRQSPASALPPLTENDFIIRPEDIQRPRGEYIPLNPDIEKPSPPRKGSAIPNHMGTYTIKKRANVIGNPMFPNESRSDTSDDEKLDEEVEEEEVDIVPEEEMPRNLSQMKM